MTWTMGYTVTAQMETHRVSVKTNITLMNQSHAVLSSQIITDTFLVGKYWPAVKTSDLEINGNFPIDFGENRVAARAHQSNFNSFNSH